MTYLRLAALLGLLGCPKSEDSSTDTAPGTTPTGGTGETGGTTPTPATGDTSTTTATATTGDTGGNPNPPSGFSCSGAIPTYAADVEPIFLSCGGAEACHQLSLGKPGGAIPYLVDQPTYECGDHRLLVAPTDPENSYLIDKLTDQGNCFGSPMPKPLAGAWHPLPDAEVQAVYDWICSGALDQ